MIAFRPHFNLIFTFNPKFTNYVSLSLAFKRQKVSHSLYGSFVYVMQSDNVFVVHCKTGRVCPKLVNFKNGNVELGCRYDTRRYGQKCQHSCNSGYRLKGNVYRECLANGTWSGTEATCEIIHPGK